MANFNIIVGTKVDVSRQVQLKNGEDSPILSSKVVDVIDEKTMVLSMPMDKTVTVPLSVNEKVQLFFYTPACMLSAFVAVKERYYEGSFPVVKIGLVTELTKLQRREYYRIECHMPFRFGVLSEQEITSLLEFKEKDRITERKRQAHIDEMEEKKAEWQSGIIVDLSGGGIRFVTDAELYKNDAVILSLELQNGEEKSRMAIIARLISVEEKREVRGKREVRAGFYKLTDTFRDTIVKYVFDEERRILSKTK